MTTITADLLTRLAKSVSGEMRHTQKLDAFAKVLGYPDQTALMGDLKKKASAAENAAASKASVAPFETITFTAKKPMPSSLDEKISEMFEIYFERTKEDEDDNPFPRSEWREDVARGDVVRSGYEDWRISQVEQFIDECGCEDLLKAYVAWIDLRDGILGTSGEYRLLDQMDWAGDRYETFGADMFGDEAMDLLSELLSDVREGIPRTQFSRQQRVDRFERLVSEALDREMGIEAEAAADPSP